MIISIIFSLLSSVSLSTEQQFRGVDKFAYIGDMPIDTVKKYKTRRNSWGDVIVSLSAIARTRVNYTEDNQKFDSYFDLYRQNGPILEPILSAKYISNFSEKFTVEVWSNLSATYFTVPNSATGDSAKALNDIFGLSRASNIYRGSVGINLIYQIRDWVNIALHTDNTARERILPVRHYDKSITDSFVHLFFSNNDNGEAPEVNSLAGKASKLNLAFNGIAIFSANFSFEPADWIKISPSVLILGLANVVSSDFSFSHEFIEGLSIRALIKPSYSSLILPSTITAHVLSAQNVLELSWNCKDIIYINLPVYGDFSYYYGKGRSTNKPDGSKYTPPLLHRYFFRAGINPNIVADWEFADNFYLTGKVAMSYDFFGVFSDHNKENGKDVNIEKSSFLTSPVFRYALSIRFDTR